MATLVPANPILALKELVENARKSIDALVALDDDAASAMSLHDFGTIRELDTLSETLGYIDTHSRALRHRLWSRTAWMHNHDKSIVNRLPPEILSRIFELVQGDRSLPDNTTWIKHGRRVFGLKQWIQVTEVCKRWRRIALDCPQLWNNITCTTYSKHVNPWLVRCKGMQLNLHIPDYDGLNKDMQTALALRCPQLRRLDIDKIDKPKRLRVFNAPAPLLEYLCIAGEGSSGRIPPDLFAGSTPRLKNLFLRGVMQSRKAQFSNLSHIHLSEQKSLSIHDLLALIRASPRMETLVLRACIAVADLEAQADTVRADSSAAVRPLALKGIAFEKCSAALLRILLPLLQLPSEGVAMLCDQWSPEDVSGDSIFPLTAQSGLGPLLDVQVLSINASTSEIVATDGSSAARIAPHGYYSHRADLFDIHRVMGLQALQELHISQCDAAPRRPVPWWRSCFGQLSSLRKLVLEGPHPEWFSTLLPDDPLHTNSHPLPTLHTLELIPTISYEVSTSVYRHTLASMVASRHENAHPIRELQIVCRHLPASYCSTMYADETKVFTAIKERRAALEAFVDELHFTVRDGRLGRGWSPIELPSAHEEWLLEVMRGSY